MTYTSFLSYDNANTEIYTLSLHDALPILSEASIKEMRRLGIIASVQPRFVYSDQWANDRLGPERLSELYPFSSMSRAGIMLAAGSDCPVEDPNPFEGIWSAVSRPGLAKKARLTVGKVLVAYTK